MVKAKKSRKFDVCHGHESKPGPEKKLYFKIQPSSNKEVLTKCLENALHFGACKANFVIGHNAVMRALERNSLNVLVISHEYRISNKGKHE